MVSPETLGRLHAEVETIARSESPLLTLTTVSHDGMPHSATMWFAPTAKLDLLTFSSPSRIHSTYIDNCADIGAMALVSGTMHEEGQTKSTPPHGLSFEGDAVHLDDADQIEEALNTFRTYETFTDEEIDKYLNHPEPEIPPHGVYKVNVLQWTVFDGRLGGDNPDRLVRVPWPPLES